ncbi:bifunctional 4-hydroxy-2-oxoglutarate aldolase/2-dehydro-3-deoxy-phosphogluconate aldolase [Teredinibacter sp. KSP-S5-2]|uniref:bifunctional 4-hydroxy-2-oxoglutarate aldolase/2-dehydro-3-deoxy-phosphogluconate aldolase n=1 Tax=Teredinibacter sp. KSP-S5-2 TaxID=3034506 RepID=UPI0029345420|nr:bifunctional 4-hydroxy-2-oxoglutarate aldolase/2-dehydro-3-deoxy-phosphogluconate aldolase [Teredinibacter sp. KSP-S5-2]WNO11098.1 bifunctional 4-hydroxy-2-oxoglutarate aldolase/2-dehydro-3-deoxy-phosphogluconate aldolase [Teredinibacter sp. KSP-S5-2]
MAITKEFLQPFGVMPVVVIHNVEDAVPITNALKAGGINAVEVTLRTPCALDAIRAIKNECEGVSVGVGTVVNTQNLEDIAEIGVDFAVSPGYTPNLIKSAQDLGVDLLPGVASPSEVMMGMELGLSCFKLFPAVAVGGLPLLKSIGGPLPQVSFCPTGGLTVDTFTDFLALPNVACVGGTWLVPPAAVENKDWQAITEIARQTMAKITE